MTEAIPGIVRAGGLYLPGWGLAAVLAVVEAVAAGAATLPVDPGVFPERSISANALEAPGGLTMIT